MKRIARALFGSVAVGALLLGCSGQTAAPTTTPATSAAAESTTPAPAPTTPAERVTMNIASLKGPTTMGLVKLMDDATKGAGKQDYKVTMYGSPDEVVPLVVQGKVDVALIPSNLAAVLYQQTKTDAGPAVQVAAINTLGVLQIVENGNTVHTWADLKGKTIYTTGKGTTPEYVLDYLLAKNGLDPAKDVTVAFESEATALGSRVTANPGTVAVLPQPYVTVVEKQTASVRTVFDLTDEWTKVSDAGSQLITGVLVVRTAFVKDHPAAFADFLADYQASTKYTNDDPAGAAALIAAAGIVPAAPVAQAAIPASHVTYIAGADMKTALSSYLQVLFTADPKSVGGTMPGDDFYFGS
ncbi:MAG TPA: ABC transporter substrate-binding protein [Cellulomonas sp.]